MKEMGVDAVSGHRVFNALNFSYYKTTSVSTSTLDLREKWMASVQAAHYHTKTLWECKHGLSNAGDRSRFQLSPTSNKTLWSGLTNV